MSDHNHDTGTMPAALYGLRWPRPYVRWRGLRWLRSGFCPCCYSSPPSPGCMVCFGNYRYGHDLTPTLRDLWRRRWLALMEDVRR